MNQIEKLSDDLCRNISDFLIPLQTTRIVKRDAYEAVDQSARMLARALKGSSLVPKALLNELYVTVQILRAEAPYVKGEKAILESMANQIEMTFSLILKDEAHEDRLPGVPRVI